MVKTKPQPDPQKQYNEWSLEGIPRVGPKSRERLEEAGITSFHGVLAAGPIEIAQITNMSKDEAADAVTFVRAYLYGAGKLKDAFISGNDVMLKRNEIDLLSTGSVLLDAQLGGGIECQATTEFYAQFGAGKTQLMHTLAVNAQLPKKDGGLDGQVIYLDTENTFTPDRIIDMLLGRKIIKERSDAEPYLDNIVVARALNISHQMSLMKALDSVITDIEIARKADDTIKPVKLIIVDSLTAMARAEMIGQGFLQRKQSAIGQMANILKRLAEQMNLVVVYTNQIYEDISGFGESQRPIGGNALAHASTYRLFMKKQGKAKADGQYGVMTMVDSPRHVNFAIPYRITEKKGFTDTPGAIKEIPDTIPEEVINDKETAKT